MNSMDFRNMSWTFTADIWLEEMHVDGVVRYPIHIEANKYFPK